jgi:hypothetical protein
MEAHIEMKAEIGSTNERLKDVKNKNGANSNMVRSPIVTWHVWSMWIMFVMGQRRPIVIVLILLRCIADIPCHHLEPSC